MPRTGGAPMRSAASLANAGRLVNNPHGRWWRAVARTEGPEVRGAQTRLRGRSLFFWLAVQRGVASVCRPLARERRSQSHNDALKSDWVCNFSRLARSIAQRVLANTVAVQFPAPGAVNCTITVVQPGHWEVYCASMRSHRPGLAALSRHNLRRQAGNRSF